MKKDSIGNRMKLNYEKANSYRLTRRVPVIVRIDGRAFHTFTKRFQRPFDNDFRSLMLTTMNFVADQMQGFKLAYMQSDEISFLITDFDYFETQPWFGYELAKINSVTASMASAIFNKTLSLLPDNYQSDNPPCFDCRAFNIPREEVANYFRWRFQDCVRNSIQAVGQAFFSNKQLHKKSQKDVLNMLKDIGLDWEEEVPNKFKYGTIKTNLETTSNVDIIMKSSMFINACDKLMREKDSD